MPEVSTCAGSDLELLRGGDGRAPAEGVAQSSPDLRHWLEEFCLKVSVWDEPKPSHCTPKFWVWIRILELVLGGRAGSKPGTWTPLDRFQHREPSLWHGPSLVGIRELNGSSKGLSPIHTEIAYI